MWLPRIFKTVDENPSSNMGDFAIDEEVIRRLVERIIKLEVLHETLKRQVDDTCIEGDCYDFGDVGGNSKIMLWNRILRLEEGQQVVQKHIQELFANVMDFELQSRGEPCHLHEVGSEDEIKNVKRDVWKIIARSCKTANFTGIAYVSRKFSNSVRIFWSVILLLSISVSAVFIYCAYCKWAETPAVAAYDSLTALTLIPFPAVTICPGRNIHSLYPLSTLLEKCSLANCTDDKLKAIAAVSFLCPPLMHNQGTWTNYFNASSLRIVEEAMASCSEDIFSYDWPSGASGNCTKAFQTLYIDNRVCYSFNLLPANSLFSINDDPLLPRPAVMDDTGLRARPGWRPDVLYPQDTDSGLPRHPSGAGPNQLAVTLRRRPFLQHHCNDNFDYYQIAVHHPSDLPSLSHHQYLLLPPRHSLHIAVTPHRDVTTDSCVSQDHHPLRLFAHYSQANCHQECHVRCSVNLCGCVPFYLPRIDNKTNWCGHSHRYCPDILVPDMLKGKLSWETVAKYYRREIRDDLHTAITNHLYHFPGQEPLTEEVLGRLAPDCSCQCPASCSQTSYLLETQLLPLADHSLRSSQNKSEVNVYFKGGLDYFTTTERRKTFGFSDFIAHAGGVMALLTSVSLLSVVELMYLVTRGLMGWRGSEGEDHRPETGGCPSRQRQEWDKTAQTDPMFITDGTLSFGI